MDGHMRFYADFAKSFSCCLSLSVCLPACAGCVYSLYCSTLALSDISSCCQFVYTVLGLPLTLSLCLLQWVLHIPAKLQ